MTANPSDGHDYRANLNEPARCLVCHSWPEEHACDFCGERERDHSEEMRARCARGGRVPDCYTCGAKPWQQHDHSPVLPPTCPKCGGLGHERGWHDLVSWADIAQKHARELRAMANDLRRNEQHIAAASALGIARSSRAEAFEIVASRLEDDAAALDNRGSG